MSIASRAYIEALAGSPIAKTTARVDVLDLNHNHLGSYRNVLMGGAIQHNRGGDSDRQGTLPMLDFANDLADLDLRYLLQVQHGVQLANGDTEWHTMMTGRVVDSADDGDVTTVEIHDKMTLALAAGFRHRTWNKGMPVGRMIRDMFEDIGETRFKIPRALIEGGPRLTSRVVSGGPDEQKAPARVALRVARGRLQVFYDGEGSLVVRRAPTQPLVTWVEDDDDQPGVAATSPIRWDREFRSVRNTVVAKGKKKLEETVTVDDLMKGHVYSPSNLQRGGKPRSGQHIHYWSNDRISRRRVLRAAALKVLREVVAERAGASMECVPTPWVGAYDLVRAERRDGRVAEFFLNEATIPIIGEGDMTVGYQTVTRKRRGRKARVKL